MDKRPLIAASLFAVALLTGGALLLQQPAEKALPPVPETLMDVVMPETRPLQPFSLALSNGKDFNLQALQGKWSLLFFGYTHCPDICPTTLSTLKRMISKVQQTPRYYDDTQVVFISVDPKRDSLEHLQRYTAYFHPDFLAATGEKAEIDKLARQLGAIYMFDGDTSGDSYIVNHSATIVLVDPTGEWVGRFNPPHSADKMADDYLQLRDYLDPPQTPAG